MKNSLLILAAANISFLSLQAQTPVTTPDPASVITKEMQQAMTPQEALERLKAGNQRFLDNKMTNRDYREQAKATATGQFPFAVILGCQDSRTSSEILFDMSKGDAFHLRVAGNVVNPDMLGGIEFGTKVAGAKLVVVMGHTKCGAVKGAIDNVELGNLTTLLWKIAPAVDEVKDPALEPRTGANYKFVDKVAEANVRNMMQLIPAQSSILADQLEKKEIMLVGAMCDIETGKVTFLE